MTLSKGRPRGAKEQETGRGERWRGDREVAGERGGLRTELGRGDRERAVTETEWGQRGRESRGKRGTSRVEGGDKEADGWGGEQEGRSVQGAGSFSQPNMPHVSYFLSFLSAIPCSHAPHQTAHK